MSFCMTLVKFLSRSVDFNIKFVCVGLLQCALGELNL